MKKSLNVSEYFLRTLPDALRADRTPFLCALTAGFLAHGFAFSNKLVNGDELASLFSKGMTVASGRWGLELSSFLFPDVSMPWIYGLLCLVMLAAAACLTLRIFRIEHPLLRTMLAALIPVFPSQTATFSFLFTSPSYALAFLLAVAAVWASEREGWKGWLLGLLLLLLSVSTYQAYIAVASSFFVLRMLQRLLRDEGSARDVLLYGLKRLALLAGMLAVYYVSVWVAKYFYGGIFETYGVEHDKSLLYRAAIAYSAFLHIFTRGYFMFIRGTFSQLLHLLGLGLTLWACLRWFLRVGDGKKRLLFLLCLLLFPLSIQCIYLIAEVGIITAMVLYSFVSVYVFAAVALESADAPWGLPARRIAALSFALIALGNAYFANAFYLKEHLDYENAYAAYTGLAAQIRETPGFDASCKIAVLGSAQEGLYRPEELDMRELTGASTSLVDVYTREFLIRRYVGFDVPFADEAECFALGKDPRVQAMPSYPYYGCVQKIDDYIVVHLSN